MRQNSGGAFGTSMGGTAIPPAMCNASSQWLLYDLQATQEPRDGVQGPLATADGPRQPHVHTDGPAGSLPLRARRHLSMRG
jgi:hypothetical protein